MSKFDYPSRYYADDKDVCDLLSEPHFTSKKLLRFARARGIFVSSELSRTELIGYISQLPFSFAELIKLIKSIETDEKEENRTTERIHTGVTVEQFQAALKHIQQARGQLNSEVYQITPTDDGATVFIRYRELDHRSTRVLQWTDHTMEIQARKVDAGFEVRYTMTDRGQDIVNSLIEKLAQDEKKEKKVDTINLTGITDPTKRTEFFRMLAYGLEGMRVENIKKVRMNRLTKDAAGNVKTEAEELSLNGEEEEEDEPQESPTGMVKGTTFVGDSIFTTQEFQDFCKRGFFASRVLWTVVEKDANARKFELETEFKDAESCRGFQYKLRGLWARNEDGELQLTKSAIGLADRNTLASKIEVAAYSAMATVSAPAAEETSPEANRENQTV